MYYRSPRGITFSCRGKSKNLSCFALKNLYTYVKYQNALLLFLLITVKEFAHSSHCCAELFSLRKHNNTEVVRFRPAESSAGDNHNILAVEIIHCKLLIICNVKLFDII